MTNRRVGPRHLPADWPLAGLFVLYPLWWLIGVADMAGVFFAAAMAVHLHRRGRISVPRGFTLWALFLAWVVVGVLVLQVDAPGAVPGVSASRYLTWGYRLVYYLAATVVLLYVGNLRRELSSQRVFRILSCMFVTIVAGGLLGIMAPHLDFPSLLEVVLPRRVAAIPFVHAQVHPTVAELQDVLGYENPRPSAPFAYSNTWGLNFACFLPFFVTSWFRKDAGWRRAAAPVVLAVALIPVIFSLNRGLWLALVLMSIFVAVRSAMHGNVRTLGALIAAGLVVVGVVSFTPLGSTIQARFTSEDNSNEARANLGTLSMSSMAEKSPIVGFGTTRNVQGNFLSIAGGATAACPHCSPPALGTQGRLWLVSFAQGFGGLVLYLAFFALQFLRHITMRGSDVAVGLCVLLVQSVTLPVYDWSGSALFAVMIGIALLWRARVAESPAGIDGEAKLAEYLPWSRRHAAVLVCGAVVGVAMAGGWQYRHGAPATATVSIVLPPDPQFPDLLPPSQPLGPTRQKADVAPTTLDTEAQLLSSRQVTEAVSAATGEPSANGSVTLAVSAEPNSRILIIAATARTREIAAASASAAADTLLRMRGRDLLSRQSASLHRIAARTAALSTSVTVVNESAHRLQVAGGASVRAQVRALHDRRDRLIEQWSTLVARQQRVASMPLPIGHVVHPAQATVDRRSLPVPFASGLMLGLVAAICLAGARDVIGSRAGRRRDMLRVGGLPVVARLSANRGLDPGTTSTIRQQVALALATRSPDTYVSVGSRPEALSVAAELDRSVFADGPRPQSDSRPRLVLVASAHDRLPRIARARRLFARFGADSVGIILVRK